MIINKSKNLDEILEELIRKNYRQAGQKASYSYYEIYQAKQENRSKKMSKEIDEEV